MKTQQTRRVRSFVLAAAALSLAATTALYGQYRTGNDGHVRDANNRVGSGGMNQGGSSSPYAVNGNQMGNDLVTNNITGGRGFRGNVGYVAPGAFSGQVAGRNTDRFVGQSAGIPIGTYNNNNAQDVMPYYGLTYNAPPPPGISNVANASGQYLPVAPDTRMTGDVRLGNPFSTIAVEQAKPGQLILPGPVDPTSNSPTLIAASPLFGVRPFRVGQEADDRFLSTYTNAFAGERMNNKLDPNALDSMRAELSQQTPDGLTPNPTDNALNPNPNQPNDTTTPNGPLNNGVDYSTGKPGAQCNEMTRTVDRPFDAPQTSAIDNQPLTNTAGNTAAMSGDLRTNQGTRNKMLANIPRGAVSNTSPQYRELQRRLSQYRTAEGTVADVEANRKFQEERRAVAAGSGENAGTGLIKPPGGPLQPGPNQPGGLNQPPGPNQPAGLGAQQQPGPTGMPAPGATNTPAPGTEQPILPGVAPATAPSGLIAKPKPLQITSLAKDMKQTGAADMMKQAEQDMKDQKFTRALDKFDMIEQIAPSDPLVMLGRATAELGASYYSRADAHLREASTKNEELLMGQYDLHVFLGDDRLTYLVKDLKELANRQKTDPRYPFLLAYIAYNTGNEANASAYLDLADKRAGGRDPFFKLLRTRWSLPESTTPAPEGVGDMNK